MPGLRSRAGFSAIVLLALSACQSGGGEPQERDIYRAYAKALETINAKGGISLNMGSAGANQTITFDMRLHAIEKKSCTGKDRVYTCDVTTKVSYPPVNTTIETHDVALVLFDGPGGWRIVE